MAYTVVLDAGHGASDLGATYEGRQEKDDTLALTLAVGDILSRFEGINVVYTRDEDVYDTPTARAERANAAGADYFVSIHRNSTPEPNTYSGIETLVYNNSGRAAELAKNIDRQLEAIGFNDLGITERKNLSVLKRTTMPAVLLEVGYINNDKDNAFFDEHFDEIARAIADGILVTLGY